MEPALRPAWGLAALALVLAVAFMVPRPLGRGGGTVLRGEARPAQLTLERGEWRGDGLLLSWRGGPAANTFELRFYSTTLTEIGRSGPYADSSVALPLATLPFRAAFGDSVVVRVVGLQDGDVVATSDARVLTSR